MKSLDDHLQILREILTEHSPLPWGELAAKVLARAAERKLETSEMVVARLAIAALANLEPAGTAFPEVPKILVLLADGRFKLKGCRLRFSNMRCPHCQSSSVSRAGNVISRAWRRASFGGIYTSATGARSPGRVATSILPCRSSASSTIAFSRSAEVVALRGPAFPI